MASPAQGARRLLVVLRRHSLAHHRRDPLGRLAHVAAVAVLGAKRHDRIIAADDVRKPKRQSGRNILVYGSGRLVRALIEHDLSDHLGLMVHPVVPENRQAPFQEGHQRGPEADGPQAFSASLDRVMLRGTMDRGGSQKRTYRMPAHHGWRSKPGYKIFVANRGDVRFDIPRKWVISMPGRECDVEFRDRKEPHDDCIIQLSVWRHPPGIDWTGLPLEELAGARGGETAPGGRLLFAQQPATLAEEADRDTLWRGEPHYEKRPGAELVWHESAFLDRVERREARARQCVARGPQSHAIITMSYWPEHEGRFLPVWGELLRTLTLGVYIRDPLLGE